MAVRAIVLSAAMSAASCFMFDVPAGGQKCLSEVLSKNEIAHGSYAIDGPTEGPTGFEIKIRGPNGDIEFQQRDSSGSKISFSASDSGKDYSELAKREQLKPLELELRKLEDRIDGVHREMLYQREREEAHRNTNESTNNRVQWFALLTIVIVVAVSAGQVFYLHSFFKRKKYI